MNRIKPEDFDKHTHDTQSLPNSQDTISANVVWSPTAPPQTSTPPIQNVAAGSNAVTSQSIANKPVGSTWKVTTALFATLAVILGFGWQSSYRQSNAYYKEVQSTKDSLAEQTQRGKEQISILESQLASEKKKREKISYLLPIIVSDIKFKNADTNGNSIGDYSKSFLLAPTYYIYWYATIINTGNYTLSGDLYVQYLRPDGSIIPSSSSSSYTDKKSISIADESFVYSVSTPKYDSAKSIYTTKGTYTARFWWNNKIVAEEKFEIN